MLQRIRNWSDGNLSTALMAIVVAALILRLVYSFAIFPIVGEKLNWKGVDDGYDEIARNLLDGHGYVDKPGRVPNLLTPPGYVFFLYLLYGAAGQEVNEGIRVQVAQSLLDAACCLMIFLLGRRLFRGNRVALLAALAWALYPQIIVYSARVAPEVLFTFLLTTMTYFWVRTVQEGRLRDAVLLGLTYALAALVKEKIVFLPPLILLTLFWRIRASRSRRLIHVVIVALTIAASLTPWLVRGYRVTGLVYPITMRSGRALNQGLNENFEGADTSAVRFFQGRESARERGEEVTSRTGGAVVPNEEMAEWAAEGAARERSLIGKSLDRITADPIAFLRAFAVKSAAFWYYGQPKVIVGNMMVQLPLLFLAIAGYIRRWKEFDLVPFLVLTLYFVVIHAMTIVRMRYSIPIMPETILMASLFLVGRRKNTLPRSSRPPDGRNSE